MKKFVNLAEDLGNCPLSPEWNTTRRTQWTGEKTSGLSDLFIALPLTTTPRHHQTSFEKYVVA